MKAIKTHELTPLTMPLSETEKLWIYNGLDCCVTSEVLHVIKPQLDDQTRATYEFSKALQAPVLEMKLRGVLVDYALRDEAIKKYEEQIKQLSEQFNYLTREGIGMSHWVKFGSPKQLMELFYDRLQIPSIKKRRIVNGEYTYTPTVDRDALEQLDSYFLAQPLIAHILRLRDIAKKTSVLRTDIDPDGRMRTSYNIAGTNTGRFSSSLSDFGTGTNLQNIEDTLRSVFVADKGMKFAYIDLEQAESRLVGAIEWNLFHDGTYLDACESGDLHTSVCRLAWPLTWSGDLRRDKEMAEQPFYRQHSYRHMAKVLGHGTNYGGKPVTMAKHTKLDARLIAEFQAKYFRAFPSHQRWHAHVASQVQQYGHLTSLSGRRRWFFGKRNDDSTIRAAIAYDPQGSVGDILNRGMLKVWRLDLCQLLLQVHDAILIQYPEDLESSIIPVVLKEILVPLELKHGRKFVIPSEAKVGWNWASFSESNPDGLKKWAGSDSRKRERPSPTKLDQLLHSTN